MWSHFFWLSPSLTINIYLINAHTLQTNWIAMEQSIDSDWVLPIEATHSKQTTSRLCPAQSHQIFGLCSWQECTVSTFVVVRRNVKRNWCQPHKRICICYNYYGSDVISHQIALDFDCFCFAAHQLSYKITQSDLKLVPIQWHKMVLAAELQFPVLNGR